MNKKAEIILQRILRHRKFHKLLNEYRRKLNIPDNGFETTQRFNIWFQEHINDMGIGKGSVLILDWQFVSAVRREFPEVDKGWNYYFRDYLYFNRARTAGAIDTSGCEILDILNNDLGRARENLKPGVYINIGLNSTREDIINFVKQEIKWIRHLQGRLRKAGGVERVPKIKPRPNLKRDLLILDLSKKSIQELKKISGGGVKNYKDIQISKIMERLHGITVSPDNVRRIIPAIKRYIGD